VPQPEVKIEIRQIDEGVWVPKHVQAILSSVAPEALERFIARSIDYGDNHAELGGRGQFADIWRKVGKLKRAMWDGVNMTGEQPEEIVQDLIGHCLLTLLLLREEGTG
jgi:muconolactone delta-isomerase